MSILICLVFLLFICAFDRVLFSLFSDGVVAVLLETEEDEDDDVPLIMRR